MKHAILLMWHKNFKQLKELIEFSMTIFAFMSILTVRVLLIDNNWNG